MKTSLCDGECGNVYHKKDMHIAHIKKEEFIFCKPCMFINCRDTEEYENYISE